MGMFDSIKINSEKLPISAAGRVLLRNVVFQTKDLEKCLLMYQISDEGELLLSEYPDKENKTEKIAVIFNEEYLTDFNLKELTYSKISFHGYLRFYTMINDVWYEFKAKFTDDMLISIERISKND
jgi:hypothetical protein